MSQSTNKFSLKTIVLLLSLLVAMLFAFFCVFNDQSKTIDRVASENKLLQNQFDEIIIKYDSLYDIVNENQKINSIIQSVQNDSLIIEVTSSHLPLNKDASNLERQVNVVKQQIKLDTEKITSLNSRVISNKKILNQLESNKTIGTSGKIKSDKLVALNVNARGVKIVSNTYNNSANKNKINQLRVCFTLEENEFIPRGVKDIYIQIVSPKNQIMSTNDSFVELNGIKLVYSEKVEAMFSQNDTDVCSFVDLDSKKLVKGRYIINIYNSFSKIGSTVFEYN